MLSLIAIGMPCRVCVVDDLSSSSARASAPPRSTSRNAFNVSLSFTAALSENSTVLRTMVTMWKYRLQFKFFGQGIHPLSLFISVWHGRASTDPNDLKCLYWILAAHNK